MLSFATEFPVNAASATDFICVVRDWILNSPHTEFRPEQIPSEICAGKNSFKSGKHTLRTLITEHNKEHLTLARLEIVENDIIWITSIVLSQRDSDTWVGVRTFRESSAPTVHLPSAKKPIIVESLVNRLGGALDGEVRVSSRPLRLSNDDILLGARLLLGDAGCHLPVVYLSSNFSGGYALDPNSLARDLSGMAHVVVEPNRAFSRRLQIEVESINAYGGATGIYWPDGIGRRYFSAAPALYAPRLMRNAIRDEIRSALVNRRPLTRCTESAVEEMAARNLTDELRASNSTIANQYAEAFDSELNAKETELRHAEREILRLKAELRRFEANSSPSSGVSIRIGTEQNLHDDEIKDIIISTLSVQLDNLQHNSRRRHVVAEIISANPATGIAEKKRDEIKKLLRDYHNMSSKLRKDIEDFRFSIFEDGKHYKLIYREDDRYTFILPKSGSDHRGGLNSVSDISKRIF